MADTRRKLGTPQKGFKLVPPRCSGMISFGQLDVLMRGVQGEAEGAKQRWDMPKAELGSSTPQLAPAGQCWRRLAQG